jgi:hypothetical protein
MTPAPTQAERARPVVTPVTRSRVLGVGLAAWLVPGAGHLLLSDVRRAAVFFLVIVTMIAVGLAFDGQLFPFQMSEPLVFLAAVAQWAALVPRILAALGGLGAGGVTSITYEYGNTFLIVSGLLNVLILLDAMDRARGRTTR